RTEKEKFEAAVEEIRELHNEERPVLVGTISIEKSERLSSMLKKQGIKHAVLNAKQHEKEAEIVSMAGQPGAVTISTNMAGRGTDIVLGPGVADKGGLHILGTERHESRRIDNQLRGRSGRQGDRGSSRFYLSLEDDLLRIFGSDRISGIMDRLGMDGEPIEHSLVTRGIENAQKRVEGHNFDIRKHLLEYDDVMNKQREVVYAQRREVLEGNLKEDVLEMISEQATGIIEQFTDAESGFEDWEIDKLAEALYNHFGIRFRWTERFLEEMPQGRLIDSVVKELTEAYEQKENEFGSEDMRYLEGVVMLANLDGLWKDHLLAMDHLKEGIGLRGYAQQDPLRAYQKEGYEMFLGLLSRVKENTIRQLFRIKIEREAKPKSLFEPKEQEMVMSHGGDGGSTQAVRKGEKVGRNAPCPCGSGKKYKKCCGR
ncbi:MAG: SEC-C domain-containing protein, partial [Deltaproteobacteria bacterium]|nr:SEC-C domain-containing protein [Deltaproteobacteria bacterium]